MTAGDDAIQCTHCGSAQATKLVSRFYRVRNEDDRIDAIADQLEMMGEPESASQMQKMVREMGKAMDEDLSDEMEEMFELDQDGELGDDE